MDSTQVVNYVFIIGGLLIVTALILYRFFPKLRKNSFKVEGWEELPKYIPLKERYKKEIESKEIIHVKGKYGDLLSNNKLITLLVLGSITLVVLMPYCLILLSESIGQCVFNEHFSLHLFNKYGDGFTLASLLILLLQIQRILRQILYGKRTGLDNNPDKKYYFDTVIRKYNNANLKDDLLSLMIFLGVLIFMISYMFNWEIINKSTSFAQANKIAYQECMAQNKKIDKLQYQ